MRVLAGWALLLVACSGTETPKPKKNIDDFLTYLPLVQHVDTRIGTGGDGNTFPGPTLPHGFVKLSPDTAAGNGDISSYEADNQKIEGFSHTHLEGPGGSFYGYSQLLVMPARGEIKTTEDGYASRFSHDSEAFEAGYYAVHLDDPKAKAELTATSKCGYHRYTFEGSDPGHILLDLAHTRGGFFDGQVEIVGDHALRGHATYEVSPQIALVVSTMDRTLTTGRRTLSFYAEFSRPFAHFGTWSQGGTSPGARQGEGKPVGAWATFDDVSQPIELKLCVSGIDAAQAEATFRAEAQPSFDDAKSRAKEAWNKLLNRIQVKGGTDRDRRLFYTALYHAFLEPTDVTEAGRFWSGEDGIGRVETAQDWRYFTDDWCLWDTFRTTHPLQTLVEPETRDDVVRSLVHGYETGGWISKCTWQGTGYSRVMIANPFVPVLADAYVKGFRRTDPAKAYEAVRHSEMEEQPESLLEGVCGYFNQGTPPEYVQNGWVSHECDPAQSASMTLEHAFDDWAMSRYAAARGNADDQAMFEARAKNWRKVFNPEHGFAQGRRRDGTWVEPFDPAKSLDFTEASSWIYTWSVQHDVQGLVHAVGGREAFVKKLDAYFDGHHDMSNEPGFHTPYLYLYAGAPEKTQDRVRDLLGRYFKDGYEGLPGNDDAGATSAWYVFGAIGLYPVSPGDGTLLIGSPTFEEATLWLEPNSYAGKSFTVVATGTSNENRYVQSATLNGQPLTHAWITHDDLVKGGRLELVMGATPSAWGSRPEDVPPSMTK